MTKSQVIEKLTDEQLLELEAVREAVDTLLRPTFIHRTNWPEYAPLVERSLLTWGPPPTGFSDDFAGVEITTLGRAALKTGGE